MRKIEIEPVLNGFIVRVGCQRVVFTSIKEMLLEIERYQKDPNKVEKDYMERALNHEIHSPYADAPAPGGPIPPAPMGLGAAAAAQMGPLGQYYQSQVR